MKLDQNLNKYLINFAPKKIDSGTKQKKNLNFFELASKTINQCKKGTYQTASSEVDKIVYGTK